jgi:peptide/nickel transport system substrate-binding protein
MFMQRRSGMQRRAVIQGLGALATMATVSLPSGRAQAAPARGGTLTFARAADSTYLDPVKTELNADIWISLNIYDTLLQPSTDGKGLEPGLAESHTVSADGTTVTLKLRPDLKFGDGSALQVSDVKWSLDRARNKETGGDFAFLLEAVANIETPSADTVVITLAHADPAILQALATFNAGIVPEKLFMAAPGADVNAKAQSFAEKPIGSGPFMMGSWTRNSEMILVRNPHYWKQAADGKKLPYLDRVRFVIMPDDATRILKLKAGEIDATEFVPFSRVAELKADRKLNMVLFPSAKVVYFNLNNRPTYKDGSKNPLSDVRVRQALNYATDKDGINQVMSYGAGKASASFMPMSTPLASGSGAPYPYDLAKAKKLLAEAGYPNGFEVACMALAGNVDDVAQLSAVQQMWSQVGVRLKIEQLESASRLARFKAGDYQMRTSLWTNDINDPNEITSYFAFYPTVQSNRSGYRNTKIEELFTASQSELDPAKRTAQYKELQQLYVADAPIVFLLEVPYPVALSTKVKAFMQIPLGNNIFANAYLEP